MGSATIKGMGCVSACLKQCCVKLCANWKRQIWTIYYNAILLILLKTTSKSILTQWIIFQYFHLKSQLFTSCFHDSQRWGIIVQWPGEPLATATQIYKWTVDKKNLQKYLLQQHMSCMCSHKVSKTEIQPSCVSRLFHTLSLLCLFVVFSTSVPKLSIQCLLTLRNLQRFSNLAILSG